MCGLHCSDTSLSTAAPAQPLVNALLDTTPSARS